MDNQPHPTGLSLAQGIAALKAYYGGLAGSYAMRALFELGHDEPRLHAELFNLLGYEKAEAVVRVLNGRENTRPNRSVVSALKALAHDHCGAQADVAPLIAAVDGLLACGKSRRLEHPEKVVVPVVEYVPPGVEDAEDIIQLERPLNMGESLPERAVPVAVALVPARRFDGLCWINRHPAEQILIRDVAALVAATGDLTLEQLCSKDRHRNISMLRQAAMFMSKMLTTKSLFEIGRRIGGRDHTTVLHAIKTCQKRLTEGHETTTRAVGQVLVTLRSLGLDLTDCVGPELMAFADEETYWPLEVRIRSLSSTALVPPESLEQQMDLSFQSILSERDDCSPGK